MRRRRQRAGFSLIELLVALGLGLAITVAAVAATAGAVRLLVRLALRAEAEDIVALGLEAFTLDVRRAGFDPRKYFPELFASFSALLSSNVSAMAPYWDRRQSLEWKTLQQFYQVDLKKFVGE